MESMRKGHVLPRQAMAKPWLVVSLCLVIAESVLAAREFSIETSPSLMMEEKFQETRRLHRPSDTELAVLQDRLGYKFKKISLLTDALTHSSFSAASNDVLNVLGGKSVMQAIALHLITQNPDVTKSELDTFIRKHSNGNECAKDAVALELDSLIMVGKGVETISARILSTAFNAVFGAITVDDGPTSANFAYWKAKEWNHSHADAGWAPSDHSKTLVT